jgi:hypothetical protein
MTDDTAQALAACWAKNRPATRAAVHWTLPGTDTSAEDYAVLAAAEAALAGPPRAHIQICARHSHVLMTYNPLLVTVVKHIPGARWCRADRYWSIPSALSDEVAERLRAAGAVVTSELLD